MSAVIVPFETKAQREDRLYHEAMAAFDAYGAAQTRSALEALVRAMDRLVAAQKAPLWPNAGAAPHASGLAAS